MKIERHFSEWGGRVGFGPFIDYQDWDIWHHVFVFGLSFGPWEIGLTITLWHVEKAIKTMILEIQNPSDAVTIEADDIVAAGVAIMIVGDGWYGLENEEGEQVVPITALGSGEAWLKEHGVSDVEEYIKANRVKMAEILESVLYGHTQDRALFNAAIEKMSKEDAQLYRDQWNDKKRSSLNDIGAACLHYAEAFRKMAGDKVELEPSRDKPLIFRN